MFNLISRLIPSLLLTTALTFSLPMIIIGLILGFLGLIGYLPGCNWLVAIIYTEVMNFLRVFGSGYPWQGIMTISLAFAFVGGLFDIFNFYRYLTFSGKLSTNVSTNG